MFKNTDALYRESYSVLPETQYIAYYIRKLRINDSSKVVEAASGKTELRNLGQSDFKDYNLYSAPLLPSREI